MRHEDLFKISYLKELCVKYNLKPSKSFGQNYLVNSGVADKIIQAADTNKNDKILEIGPGFGVLTFRLADLAEELVAFEIEKKLKGYWKKHQKKNIKIIWGDVLKKLPEYLENKNDFKYKVVANLPYQITSKILRMLFELKNKPDRIVVMVQYEVAERMVAKKGNMNLLALSVQFFSKPKIVSKVSSGSFWPQPQVDSAVVKLENIKAKENEREFFVLARAGFSSKRKQLWKNLYNVLDIKKEELKNIIFDVCGNQKIRAENLSFDEWFSLVSKLKEYLN